MKKPRYCVKHRPTYRSWVSMRRRCRNKNHATYRHYGGRGIRVCERWLTYENFEADMGPRPSEKHTIDRIDNDGNYEPGNCRWATALEQTSNSRRNRLISFGGKTMTLAQWGRTSVVPLSAFRSRFYNGWDLERALYTPSRGYP